MHSPTSTLPSAVLDHVEWCADHQGDDFDHTCNTERWSLSPAAALPADPGNVELCAFEYSDLPSGAETWRAKPPAIELFVGGNGDGSLSTLTPQEARQVAAELLNLADLVEHKTGRVAR